MQGGSDLMRCVLFRHALGRPVDALSLRELCDLQRGAGRFESSGLERARLLASLCEKPDFINVQVGAPAHAS